LDSLTAWLADETHSPVADKTGLTQKYDLALQWSEDLAAAPSAGDPPYPLIFTALQEQLGLKLEPSKAPIDTVIIAHIEPPSAN
jgi:bla regulator protein blaR1